MACSERAPASAGPSRSLETHIVKKLLLWSWRFKHKGKVLFLLALLVLLLANGPAHWTAMLPAEARLAYLYWRLPVPEDREPEAPMEQRKAGGTAVFDGIEFVWCPVGTFRMGNDAVADDRDRRLESPAHPVTLTKGFWLGKYELIKADWNRVMETQPWRECMWLHETPTYGFYGNDRHWWSRSRAAGEYAPLIWAYLAREPSRAWRGMYDPATPATHVEAEEAYTFLNEMNANGRGGYRWPTEAEWEYACRAGASDTCAVASRENADETKEFARAVGHGTVNVWGLCDMLGNVREYTHGGASEYQGSAVVDPGAAPVGTTYDDMVNSPRGTRTWGCCVARGGSFRDDESKHTCTSRGSLGSNCEWPSDYTGYRLLREAE